MKMKISVVILLAVMIHSCVPFSITSSPSPTLAISTLTATSRITSTVNATITPSQTPLPTISIPERALSQEGPWLLVSGSSSLYAFNSDGSGQTSLISPAPTTRSISPSGKTLAYIITSNSGLQLRLMQLPNGPDILITNLQNPALLPAEELNQENIRSNSREAIEMSFPQWSHDGKYIAFVGQQSGPSSDLYVYDVIAKTVSRLTDGPGQSYNPVWSPDDEYIFSPGVWSFGTGAGYADAGSWIVSRDGSRVIETTSGKGTDQVMAWVDSRHLLMASWSQPCGLGFLKTYNINQETFTDVWPYYFDGLHYVESTGMLILNVPPGYENCIQYQQQPTGLMVFDKVNLQPRIISNGDYHWVREDPSNDGSFLLGRWEGWSRLTLPDTIVDFPFSPTYFYAYYSPQAQQWLWEGKQTYHDALWMGDMINESKLIYDGEVNAATWAPDNQDIFFIPESDGLLYIAKAPSYQFQPVSTISILEHSYCYESCLTWAIP